MTFPEILTRVSDLMFLHGIGSYEAANAGWRFDLPRSAWKVLAAGMGGPSDPPATARLWGVPVRVDDQMPDDAIRLVEVR